MRWMKVRCPDAPTSFGASYGSRWLCFGMGSFLTERGKALRVKDSAPVREWLTVAALRFENQFFQAFHTPEKLLEKPLQGVEIVVIPFGRDFLCEILQHAIGKVFRAANPRAERFHAGNAFVHAVAGVEAAQGRIGIVPLAGVEAESLIDHHGRVTLLCAETRGRRVGFG